MSTIRWAVISVIYRKFFDDRNHIITSFGMKHGVSVALQRMKANRPKTDGESSHHLRFLTGRDGLFV